MTANAARPYLAILFVSGLAACQSQGAVLPTQPQAIVDGASQSQIGFTPAAASTRLPDQPAPNFGFTFEYAVCYREALDTFQHVFRREVGTDPVVTATVTLSDGQMRAVYDKLVEIDFFSYASPFSVPTPISGVVSQVMPAYRYSLAIRNGDLTHSVAWDDDLLMEPTSAKVRQLRELFTLIREIVQAHPAVQSLPPPEIGCV